MPKAALFNAALRKHCLMLKTCFCRN